MTDTTTTPNMLLPVPNPSQAPGPDWAGDIVTDMYGIDSHNHTPDQGVQIPPDGLDINDDLTFKGNNATNLRSTRFTAQVAPLAGATDLGCLYVSGADLYYNDEAGNQVRITQSGSVTGSTGTITGLPSGTASASYAASTFTFQSATNTPANMAVGPISIGRNAASSKVVTLTPSAAQASDYGITLPAALPAGQSAVVVNGAGTAAFTRLIGATYAPSVSGGTGSAQAALANFSYMRIDDMVWVSGWLTGTMASATLITTISVPILPSSNFSHIYDVSGTVGLNYIINEDTHPTFSATIQAVTSAKTVQINIAMVGGSGFTLNYPVMFMYSCT